ncbi:zinc ion binding [Elasticomyces elasticus]|uniref:Zinc ion binding n=1 Tax=Exophiala sideris TaxID=1016849 RepID=A0ABR0J1T8_9EURO|nr:zinc ion binding [Elasticomyces elasticus]KAK5023708.1 zinc ion binding [Exophiala sideris]KAK5029707.1 zinc ion binding [Exophiala sideris]KAK5053497.1 zinc ion binding [Exophiala sideris]KAK5179255.1 zinc ion binding [Eurotiomycetes sp. CCFEE 6388]
MTTMRGWVFRTRGTPAQVLKLEDNLPRPTASSLGAHDVLVKVKYSSLFQAMAMLMTQIPHINSKPWIPEATFSGVIEAVGNQVSRLKVQEEVFGGMPPNVLFKYGGTLAEYIVVPEQFVVRKPDNLSFEGAGGIALHVPTAQQFAEIAKLKKGSRVLITGASSGTGSIVVQVARDVVGDDGLVVGTCSSGNARMVEELGVHKVIDYTKHPILHEYLAEQYDSEPFDAIIDIVGGDWDLYKKCESYLKPDGVFIFVGDMSMVRGEANILALLRMVVSRRCLLHQGQIDAATLQKAAAYIAEGKVKPVTDSVVEMEDVLKGYERVFSGRAKGKVIVHVQD